MKKDIILLAITILLLAGCGCTQIQDPTPLPATTTTLPPSTETPVTVSTPSLQQTPSVSDNTIRIKSLVFDPADITVPVGSTVRWVNQDSVPHRIQFSDTKFSPVLLASGQSGSQKFDRPGVFTYMCSIHPEMYGSVTVKWQILHELIHTPFLSTDTVPQGNADISDIYRYQTQCWIKPYSGRSHPKLFFLLWFCQYGIFGTCIQDEHQPIIRTWKKWLQTVKM